MNVVNMQRSIGRSADYYRLAILVQNGHFNRINLPMGSDFDLDVSTGFSQMDVWNDRDIADIVSWRRVDFNWSLKTGIVKEIKVFVIVAELVAILVSAFRIVANRQSRVIKNIAEFNG